MGGGGSQGRSQARVARLRLYVPNPSPGARKGLVVMSMDIYNVKDVGEIVKQILPVASRNCITLKMELLQESKRADAELIKALKRAVIQVEP